MPKTIQIPQPSKPSKKTLKNPTQNGRTLATQPSRPRHLVSPRSASLSQALSLVGIAITVSVTLKGFSYIFDPSEFLGSVKWVGRKSG